jgi:acetyltransferase-like isoleucine patch superfamily enzyme
MIAIRYIIRLMAKLLAPVFNAWENEIKPNSLRSNVIIDKSSRFSRTSKIVNTANDKNKIVIGKNSWVLGELMIFPKGKILIGDNCFIGEFGKIASAKEIVIGNNVLIAHGVNIIDNNSHPLDAKEREKDFKKIFEHGFDANYDLSEKPVIIEDNVWIGFNCIILKGVTIKRGAIIAAGSLVKDDVEAYTVVAGNPCVVIKRLNNENQQS